MSRIDEELTEQFYRWELRGRGWQVFEEPVAPEPPFRPFFGHFLPKRFAVDDGRRPTFLSRLFERFSPSRSTEPTIDEGADIEAELEPEARAAEELTECVLSLPVCRPASTAQSQSFLRQASRPGESLVFEIVGTEREIVPQIVASAGAIGRAERALAFSYPDTIATRAVDGLHTAWRDSGSAYAIVELGLGKEFMLALGDPGGDVLLDVVAALDGLTDKELGVYQILFEPVTHQWQESVYAAVTDGDDRPFFINRPDLVRAAERKISAPLFGVVVRLAASAANVDRAYEIISDMAVAFSALADPSGNHLIPLQNKCYPREAHEEDFLNRQSRRSGMILNVEELSHFLSLPLCSLSRRLRRHAVKTKQAPSSVTQGGSLLLGENRHSGVTSEVRLGREERVRHMHIVGASGTGKSSLLFNLIRQDIEIGEGIGVLDPHGDLIDRVLGIVPPKRIDDVILIDPSDEEYSVGFNILSAHSDIEKTLLASDLVSVFERLSTSWGDQMNSVLRNAIFAFLESSQGGSLSDLRRFLLDPAFRKTFLKTVTDPEVVYYWEKGFPQLTGNRSLGPIVTRLDAFLSPKPIRRMVSQRANRLDFTEIMDGSKILLVKLSQGQIGRENAHLLGSLFVSKVQQLAMSRQRQAEADRRDFWLYIDEFHHFITPSMAEVLSGARKYRVGLILAHQELRQLGRDAEVASAAMSNPCTRIVFRVGDADARALESGFSYFDARDLQNLGTGEAICRIERSDCDFNLSISPPEDKNPKEAAEVRQRVITASRETYGTPRAEAEAAFPERFSPEKETPAPEIPPAPAVSTPSSDTPLPPREATRPPIVSPSRELDETLQATADALSTSLRPPDLGRGGAQHQELQQRFKAVAERFGYRAIVEKQILEGQGSVDLVLEKADWKMACEISVTNSIDYEIGNIRKCLKAQFAHIAVICPKPTKLAQLTSAVEGCLAPDGVSRVSFYSPEEFISYIERRSIEVEEESEKESPPAEERRRGYKIKRRYVELSPEEMKSREEAALKALAETMRRNRCNAAQ